MELDFDKEIDTLLRKARPAKGVFAGNAKLPHLDADGIAAFAENALPEKSRQAYLAHFADCNHCREILSDTILMKSEAVPETAFAAAPAILTTAEPWYRKLFLFPNLAYVMGSLVLVFSGFLGYLVLQNAGGDASSSEVSQIEDERRGVSGPNAGEEPVYPSASSNANMSAANMMSAAANTMANASVANLSNSASAMSNSNSMPIVTRRALDAPPGEVLAERDKDVSVAAADSVIMQQPAPPPPAPAAKARPEQQKEDAVAGAGKNQLRNVEESKLTAKKAKDMTRNDGGPYKSAGPQRNQQRSFPHQAQNDYEVAVTRAIGSKKFQRKDGIWYDSAYRGQGTTNVRRGTEQYRKLDGGLRSIAESLDGTVVTIWKDKAYRIQ
ncbi:MAG: hypothetical protein WKF92_15405 [Pyrinomonadaceae bacterium]